jgi:hypothetical protein
MKLLEIRNTYHFMHNLSFQFSTMHIVVTFVMPGSSGYPPALHRGNLHWRLGEYHDCVNGYILVFKTSAETFRLMCRPAQLPLQDMWLFEMDGTLALCNVSNDKNTIDFGRYKTTMLKPGLLSIGLLCQRWIHHQL